MKCRVIEIKKFENVLLASDFDGTLKTDDGEIPRDVIEAIEYFEENGGLFTLSTGRTLQGLCLYDHSYFNAPALLANGAMAYDFGKKEIAFLDGIGEEGINAVEMLHERFPEISIEMYPVGATFAINLNEKTENHFTNQGIRFDVISSPRETMFPWQKVMLGCTEESTVEIQQFMADNFDGISFLPTTGAFVEMLKSGVNKGSGLLKLADYLHVPHSRAYAAGDGYNDVDMLKASAGAFVPCNGAKEALDCATHIVRSNNAGAIANAIEILDEIY